MDNFKSILDKLKKETKFFNAIRIVFYIVGLILIFVGGIELMIMVYIGLFAFILGRYYEKTMSAIRDYRLSQKIAKTTYKQAEFDALKTELDSYKQILKNQKVVKPAPFPSYPTHNFYDESEGF